MFHVGLLDGEGKVRVWEVWPPYTRESASEGPARRSQGGALGRSAWHGWLGRHGRDANGGDEPGEVSRPVMP
ncbi:hypothetical protein ABE10_00320 [Bacillus toyonensis]|nr:hypothetical protein [Bacillus toyonensis]